MTRIEESKPRLDLKAATVRFCGDSGDGMQLAGSQLTNTSAIAGNDVSSFPDFPAEIRAPRGTRAGVSAFQIHFASHQIFTPGDQVDALVVMNAAALATNLQDLTPGGILIVDTSGFGDRDLKHARYQSNPLEDGSLGSFQVHRIEMSKLTKAAVKDLKLTTKEADRCRNFFAMGLVYWLFERPLKPTQQFILKKFRHRAIIAEANLRALQAGYDFGITTEAFANRYPVQPAPLSPGTYRNMTGNQALAWGLLAASEKSGCPLFCGTYPITPSSDILHELARHKNFGVKTFQAEDEIAAVTASIGAAFAGAMAVTVTSGPGMSLKAEAIGLAVMTELPLLIVNVQRAGPSTGLPTKTEQADLNQALFGRHGECPLPIVAAQSPADCFNAAIEAWRIAIRYMTPVILLSESSLANGSEPWRIPNVADLEPIDVVHPQPTNGDEPFLPYTRDERLARPWALPGTPGLMHRIGGLEKEDVTGNVNYDPSNHAQMVELRARKIDQIAHHIEPQQVEGPQRGRLLVVGWGGTYGALTSAVRQVWRSGASVAHAHVRHMAPLPANFGAILARYEKVLVPELNRGQFRALLKDKYPVDIEGLNKCNGRPFNISEIIQRIEQLLEP